MNTKAFGIILILLGLAILIGIPIHRQNTETPDYIRSETYTYDDPFSGRRERIPYSTTVWGRKNNYQPAYIIGGGLLGIGLLALMIGSDLNKRGGLSPEKD